MVTSLPLISCKDGVCVICVLKKNHWDSFEKCDSLHASSLLQLVQSYFFGPLPSPSLYGFNHFLNFIYYFSRNTWVYFLKINSDFFDNFLAYKGIVEKKSRHQFQKLKTSNGGEYVICFYKLLH
jgi:hypothetical protein